MNNLINPNDFGKNALVENSRKIEINDIVRKATSNLKKELISIEVSAVGSDIKLTTSLTRWGGIRYWFSCPVCEERKGTLFKDPGKNIIACRSCLKLDYRSHRFSKMIEAQLA